MRICPVKTAIVGCGAVSATYIPNLMHMFSIIELTAVCDIVPQVASDRAEEFSVPAVMKLEELEKSTDIELVINLTGPDAHYEVTKRMLLAGKHVFSEKPLATTYEQGCELVQLAKGKGLLLGVAPDTILGAGMQTARKMLDAGMIGQPTSCVACANRNHALNSELFPFIRRSAAGSFPYDVGIYYLTALLSLLGPVRTVIGFENCISHHKKQILSTDGPDEGWEMPGIDMMAASLKFQNGVLGSIHFNGASINTEQPLLIIYGTQGILQLGDPNRFDGSVTWIRPESEPCKVPFTHGFNGRPLPGNGGSNLGHRGIGAAEMAWAIRQERQPRCSGNLGLHALEVLQGLEYSAKEGKAYHVTSSFTLSPLAAGFYDTTFGAMVRADAELSLCESTTEGKENAW